MITYHTQGRVIYYEYQDIIPPGAKEIADEFSKISGYSLAEVPNSSSFAGLKDWFILDFNKPGFTIEVGLGENPLPVEDIDKIYSKIREMLILAVVL